MMISELLLINLSLRDWLISLEFLLFLKCLYFRTEHPIESTPTTQRTSLDGSIQDILELSLQPSARVRSRCCESGWRGGSRRIVIARFMLLPRS